MRKPELCPGGMEGISRGLDDLVSPLELIRLERMGEAQSWRFAFSRRAAQEPSSYFSGLIDSSWGIITHSDNMIVLGINAYHANASAAIIVDGRLIAAVEEERLNRVKYAAGFPARAVQYCLG